MKDADLMELLNQTATALDAEMAWLIDVDVHDDGRSTPSIPAGDRGFYEALGEQAQGLRDLISVIQNRIEDRRRQAV